MDMATRGEYAPARVRKRTNEVRETTPEEEEEHAMESDIRMGKGGRQREVETLRRSHGVKPLKRHWAPLKTPTDNVRRREIDTVA